jgi:hypothetical protein
MPVKGPNNGKTSRVLRYGYNTMKQLLFENEGDVSLPRNLATVDLVNVSAGMTF